MRVKMIYSSTAKSVIPNKVKTINCTGLTFPSNAPYAIRQPAVQKSALMRLRRESEENKPGNRRSAVSSQCFSWTVVCLQQNSTLEFINLKKKIFFKALKYKRANFSHGWHSELAALQPLPSFISSMSFCLTYDHKQFI